MVSRARARARATLALVRVARARPYSRNLHPSRSRATDAFVPRGERKTTATTYPPAATAGVGLRIRARRCQKILSTAG